MKRILNSCSIIGLLNQSHQHNIKNIVLILISLFIVVTGTSCENNNSTNDTWVWDKNKKTVINSSLNLQWDLSDFEWIIADKERMPKNMVFCAKCQEGVALSILTFPEVEKNCDVWDKSDEFLKEFISSISSQESIFPGIKYEDVESEKCHFLFKRALKFSMLSDIKDARIDTGSITMIDVGYLFIKDKTPIILFLTMPYNYIIEGGEVFINYFFSTFSYINASEETEH